MPKKRDGKVYLLAKIEFCIIELQCIMCNYYYLQVIKNTLNPTWRPFNLAENVMCGGDKNKDIKVCIHIYVE